jgi:flagellar hook-associated protein 3 FlgL
MRVTENRMIEVAAESVSRAREKAAAAGEELTSGVRAARPSQDLAGWTEGARARARQIMSDARGSAIGLARDHLDETDRALDGIGGVLARARELATQLANGTYTNQERTSAASEVNDLRNTALAFARTLGPDGAYVLAGSATTTAPFDASGAYVGNATRRQIEVGEGERLDANVPGSVLTASAGVDVFAELDALHTALTGNDVPGIRATLDGFQTAIGQVASARSDVGERTSALAGAEDARTAFELQLTRQHERAVGADPVTAASELAQAQQAFVSAQTVAQQIIAMFRKA